MIVLSAVLLTFVWRIQDLFGFIRPLRPAIVMPIIALLFFLLSADRRRKTRDVIRIRVIRIALFITCLIVLSIPGSLWPGLSFRFTLRDFLPNIIMMVVIAAAVRSFVDIERLAMVQVLGAALMSFTLLRRFDVTASGRLGALGYYDANDFAMLIVCSIPLAIYFAQRKNGKWHRLVAIATLMLLMVGLVKTGSRGGFLAVVAVGAYLLFGFQAVKAHVRFGVVAALVLMMLVAANDSYWGFVKTIFNPSEDYNWSGQSQSGRIEVWKRGLGYMRQHPLLGTGARTFPIAEGRLSPLAYLQDYGRGVRWTAAHNSFVEIGVEVGLIALGAFIFMIVTGARTAWTTGRARPPDGDNGRAAKAMGQVLVASLLGYTVAAFFLSQAYAAWLYATMGIIAGFAKLAKRGRSTGTRAVRMTRGK